MNDDSQYVNGFKQAIESIVDSCLDKRGITSYISALVTKVNGDNTIDVIIPPDLNKQVKNVLNKTGEDLNIGDSVELCMKNGKLSNCWASIKHGITQKEPEIPTLPMMIQDVDLSSYDSSYFYPLIWQSMEFVDLEIRSPSDSSSVAYNQNRFRGTISSYGWSDTISRINVYEFTRYTWNESTISKIYKGTHQGHCAIYLRGGLKYSIRCNAPLTMYYSAVTLSDETYVLLDTSENPIGSFVNAIEVWRPDNDVMINNKTLPNLIADNSSVLLNKIYPVGSIYMSVNSTSPEILFGGTWEQIKDTFLLSAGDTYGAGSIGGEATHTLTSNEMPNHGHTTYLLNQDSSGETRSNIYGGSGTTRVLSYNLANLHLATNSKGWWNSAGTTTTGGDQPHNNMPPYLAVYIWKRIG